MTFVHLEDKLGNGSEGDLNHYLEVFDTLQEPTKTVLGYTLDIASHLDSISLRDNYVIFGGYAVLSHLMSTFGDNVAQIWRGSTDIDMCGDREVLYALRKGYNVRTDMASPNLDNKRTLNLTEDTEKECKIDFDMNNSNLRFPNPEINYHFGVPVGVANPLSIIKGKIHAPAMQTNHTYDILTMLSVLEKKDYSPEKIVGGFDATERDGLNARINRGLDAYKGQRLGFFPNQDFVKRVTSLLHKRRDLPIR